MCSKAAGALLPRFQHQYCTGLYSKRQEASLLLTTIGPTTAFTVPKWPDWGVRSSKRFPFPFPLRSSAELPKKILQTFLTLWQPKHCFDINHNLTCFAEWIWFAKLGFDSRLGDFVWLNQSLLKTTIISLQNPEACKPKTDVLQPRASFNM